MAVDKCPCKCCVSLSSLLHLFCLFCSLLVSKTLTSDLICGGWRAAEQLFEFLLEVSEQKDTFRLGDKV